jgi:N,N'-diacetyllegionaminate synthase
MIESIAETAWHHEGDFKFMCNLVEEICNKTSADYVKLHITLDLDEYMSKDHVNYEMQTPWMFDEDQWSKIISIVRNSNKKLMLLLNDTKAIKFASRYNPEIVELHSVCLNVPRLQNAVLNFIDKEAKLVIGVGGSSLEEVDQAVNFFSSREVVLMFGFQNYPTKFENINLEKVRKIQSMYPRLKFGYADHTAWNEPNNELITMLGAANQMNYVEKHVSTEYGVERCDFSAAVSIEMFNTISQNIDLLNKISGLGDLSLNEGEIQYSELGPMKMAPCAMKNISKGEILEFKDFDFIRTSQVGDISQITVNKFIGKTSKNNISKGQILKISDFI